MSWVYQPQSGPEGADGADGADGKSAYEIAKENGFPGTEQEWLDSLQGEPGEPGEDGDPGSEGAEGPPGPPKDSLYGDLQPANPIIQVLPVGTFMPYMGGYLVPADDGYSPPTLVVPIPNGWLLCDGREYDQDYFKDLFEVCPVWNTGNDYVFRVPDMRGRTVFGCTYNLDSGIGQEDDYARPIKVMRHGEEWGDWRLYKHNHRGAGGRTVGGPTTSPTHNTTQVAMASDEYSTRQIFGEWQYLGTGQNLPPYTGAHFIVYTGMPTVDENGDILPECGQGPERPYKTTRMMIEQRLAEGIGDDGDRAMLEEYLREASE
jgi:microcystin-dependent protein